MDYKKLSKVIDMAVLSKEDTGMDNIVYAVYASPKVHGHRPRIKLYEGKYNESISAVIFIDGSQELYPKSAWNPPKDVLELAQKWIRINQDILLKYWNGEIVITREFLNALKQV